MGSSCSSLDNDNTAPSRRKNADGGAASRATPNGNNNSSGKSARNISSSTTNSVPTAAITVTLRDGTVVTGRNSADDGAANSHMSASTVRPPRPVFKVILSRGDLKQEVAEAQARFEPHP